MANKQVLRLSGAQPGCGCGNPAATAPTPAAPVTPTPEAARTAASATEAPAPPCLAEAIRQARAQRVEGPEARALRLSGHFKTTAPGSAPAPRVAASATATAPEPPDWADALRAARQ
jgi:hypothetical protein